MHHILPPSHISVHRMNVLKARKFLSMFTALRSRLTTWIWNFLLPYLSNLISCPSSLVCHPTAEWVHHCQPPASVEAPEPHDQVFCLWWHSEPCFIVESVLTPLLVEHLSPLLIALDEGRGTLPGGCKVSLNMSALDPTATDDLRRAKYPCAK